MTIDNHYLQVERRGPALWVTLNRPDVRNAFNPEMIAELTSAFRDVPRADDGPEGVRAVVLAGAGGSFCAGADLQWMRAMAAYARDENVADALRLAAMLDAIETCAVPVVARVHGAALGGGVGLVAACDVVVTAEGTLFGFTEARLGIAPAVIAPFVLRKIGPGHARALFVTGERFDAARAERVGLVHRVTTLERLDAAVAETVAGIAACGPAAVRACRALAADVPGMSREAARAYTAETIAALRAGSEGQEGMRAFLEKRAPRFAASPLQGVS